MREVPLTIFVARTARDEDEVKGALGVLDEAVSEGRVAVPVVPDRQDWWSFAKPAVQRSALFIYFVSRASNYSRGCLAELHLALRTRRCILIVALDEAGLRPELAARLPDARTVSLAQLDDELQFWLDEGI